MPCETEEKPQNFIFAAVIPQGQ